MTYSSLFQQFHLTFYYFLYVLTSIFNFLYDCTILRDSQRDPPGKPGVTSLGVRFLIVLSLGGTKRTVFC